MRYIDTIRCGKARMTIVGVCIYIYVYIQENLCSISIAISINSLDAIVPVKRTWGFIGAQALCRVSTNCLALCVSKQLGPAEKEKKTQGSESKLRNISGDPLAS